MIRWTAVFVSWVVDIGGSSAFSFVVLSFMFATGQLPTTIASDQRAISAALLGRADLLLVTMVGGTFFSLLAGYVGARMAGQAFLVHGLLSSAACLASDLTALDQLAQLPSWLMVLGIVLAPAAGGLGGLVRQLEVGRTRQQSPA